MLDFCEEATDSYTMRVQGAGGSGKDCDEDAAQDPSRATQPLGNVARAVVHAMSSTGRVAPQPCPDIVLAGCLVAVVFGGAKRALLQAFSERPNLFPCLAYAVKEGIPIAKRCFRDLNLHHHFPKQVVDVYLRYRPLVPLISKPGDDVLATRPRARRRRSRWVKAGRGGFLLENPRTRRPGAAPPRPRRIRSTFLR